MREYLIFRLYGPLAAWGDIAVGEYRPSFAHPSKSAIIGLLAAALGIRRDEAERQKTLTEACTFAVRVDAMGTLLRDYHTIQVPSAKRGKTHYTRRSELAVDDLNTILSRRDYRCDAAYTVAVEVRAGATYTARQLAGALAKPAFTLYLGRKSCPLALPLQPQVVIKGTLNEALTSVSFHDGELTGMSNRSYTLLYWETEQDSGFTHEKIMTRRDVPLNRTRWQFAERREHYCSVPKED
ncbi:MAG: type I-E CRISPR-associated protein Cas5/CasD [Syntrophobacteraceae bacterium]|nr:type I-E CRISPR-associated protein Cas5/CasD [Syntrophobacteraceae bacterium]